jgi:SIR2-like domain
MISVLLGAGASIEAGLPSSIELTERLISDFEQWPARRPSGQLLRFVSKGLEFSAAGRKATPPDVEAVFAAIEDLANRTSLPVAPFVTAWHPLVNEAEAGSTSYGRSTQSARLLVRAVKAVFGAFGGESEAEAFVQSVTGTGDSVGAPFGRLAYEVLHALVNVLRIRQPESLAYLAPLFDLYGSQGSLMVATLNYDLAVETLGSERGTPVATGIASWADSGQLAFDPGLQLLKLHGSINWKVAYGIRPEGSSQLPFERIEIGSIESQDRPAVIFGQGNKLRAGGPYLALLRTFEDGLADSKGLVVVGYSFRDDHVNSLIATWINNEPTRRLVICDPVASRYSNYGPLEGLPYQLVRYCRNRVTLVERTAGEGLTTAIEEAHRVPDP